MGSLRCSGPNHHSAKALILSIPRITKSARPLRTRFLRSTGRKALSRPTKGFSVPSASRISRSGSQRPTRTLTSGSAATWWRSTIHLPSSPTVNPAPAAGGGYVVQVSSQRNEADAQASYRALQGKYPSVLGSQSLLVKRVDLGEKGVYYRAFAGPFSSADQATQVCNNLKAAGGPQCLIQRN